MNYKQMLIAEKAAREELEKDQIKLKELVFKIQEYHSMYDGKFLKELDSFLNNYTKNHED